MIGKLLRLGVFVVITVGLTVWIGARIVGVDLGDRYTLHSTFDDVAGAREGDDVKLAGVVVGSVTGIDVERGEAILTFEVDTDVDLPVDTAVAVRWRNLIGQRYLALEPGDDRRMLGDGDEVTISADAVDISALIDQLVPLASAVSPDDLNRILTTVLEAFDGNAGNFDALLADLDAMLGALAERDDTVSQLLADYATVTDSLASRDAQIETMVGNLAAIGETFAANDDLLDRALVELAGFAQSADAYLGRSADDFGSVLEHLAVLTGTAADNIDGLEAALQNLPDVFVDLLPVINRGEWLRVSVLCLTLSPGPCPLPTTISDAGGGLVVHP
jgi:phospholipid/cholesterol/gamma-HCH transport system substrate-binding protein